MKNKVLIILGILLLISLIFNGLLFYCLKHPSEPESIEIIKKDTFYITKKDTCWKDKLVYKTKYDTILIILKDSVLDTIKIELPNDHKEVTFKKSEDSIDIEAKIKYHGYKAEIDSVELAYKMHFIQEVPLQKLKKFGWGVTVGPSLSYSATLNGTNVYTGFSAGISVVIGPTYVIK